MNFYLSFRKNKELQKYSWLFSETCWFIFYDEAHLMDIIIFCLFYFLTPISRGRYLIPLTCRANGELKRTQQKQCAITLWFFAEHGSWYDKIESDHTYTLYNSIIKFRIIRKITSYQIRNKLYVSTREQGGKYNAILDNMFPN